MSVVVLPNLLGQGIRDAGGAFAQGIQARNERRREGDRRTRLADALKSADLSSKEGIKKFYDEAMGDILAEPQSGALLKGLIESTQEDPFSQYLKTITGGKGEDAGLDDYLQNIPQTQQTPPMFASQEYLDQSQQDQLGNIPAFASPNYIAERANAMGIPPEAFGLDPSSLQASQDAQQGDRLNDLIGTPEQQDQGTIYDKIPNEVLLAGQTSRNPQTRAIAGNILRQRQQQERANLKRQQIASQENIARQRRDIEERKFDRQQFTQERDYAFKVNKPFFDALAKDRESLEQAEQAFKQVDFALTNGDIGAYKRDWFAKRLGEFGEGFLSPEGALLESGAKNLMIADLGLITGRPNQFLEQMLLSTFPSIGKSELSNKVVAEGIRGQNKLNRAKVEIKDQLIAQDEAKYGYAQPDIGRRYSQALKDRANEIQDETAYNIQRQRELSKGLPVMARKKVLKGTPLTREMKDYLVNKYGRNGAIERAKKLGYNINSGDTYLRLQND